MSLPLSPRQRREQALGRTPWREDRIVSDQWKDAFAKVEQWLRADWLSDEERALLVPLFELWKRRDNAERLAELERMADELRTAPVEVPTAEPTRAPGKEQVVRVPTPTRVDPGQIVIRAPEPTTEDEK